MNFEDFDIPPVKQIRNKQAEFEMRVPVWEITMFTVDGYIIAHKLFYEGMPKDIEMAISSMSAGFITNTEDFIRMISDRALFNQILIDAIELGEIAVFSILLRSIAENVMLAHIFLNTMQLGLVTFEVNNLKNDKLDIVNLWEIKLHNDIDGAGEDDS